jgi:hypothetical protein
VPLDTFKLFSIEKLSNKEYPDEKLSGDDVFHDEISRDEFLG